MVSVPYISLLTSGTSSSEIFQRRPQLNELYYNNSFFFFFKWPMESISLEPIYMFLSFPYIHLLYGQKEIQYHILNRFLYFLDSSKACFLWLLDYTAIYLIPTHERWHDIITCIFIVADRSSRNLETSLNSFIPLNYCYNTHLYTWCTYNL